MAQGAIIWAEQTGPLSNRLGLASDLYLSLATTIPDPVEAHNAATDQMPQSLCWELRREGSCP